MNVCRSVFHNGAMGYTCYIYKSAIDRTFVTCTVLMKTMFLCFNLKPDNCNLATTILGHKPSLLHKTLILGKLWLEFF